MTRKDCILIAEALRARVAICSVAGPELGWVLSVANPIADALASDNPRFDREHFLAVVRGEKKLTGKPIPQSVREARAGLIPSEEAE